MALLRKLPAQVRQLSDFNRDGLTGGECPGRTLLVAGVGNIGIEICRLGEALGMEVLGSDIVEKHPGVRYVGMDEGIARADVIACAMSLNRGNRGIFSFGKLAGAKPGTVFVNIARGELSPLQGLMRLLDEGILGGVGLDVYEDEGELAVDLRRGAPAQGTPAGLLLDLSRRDNVILTPHNAFNTIEAVERKSAQSVEQALSFLSTGKFIWEVPGE
jgi:D-lactate dehydrogenase